MSSSASWWSWFRWWRVSSICTSCSSSKPPWGSTWSPSRWPWTWTGASTAYSPWWTSSSSWWRTSRSSTRTTTKRRASRRKSTSSTKASTSRWWPVSSPSHITRSRSKASFSLTSKGWTKPSRRKFLCQNFFYNYLLSINLSSIHHFYRLNNMVVTFVFNVRHAFAQPRSAFLCWHWNIFNGAKMRKNFMNMFFCDISG